MIGWVAGISMQIVAGTKARMRRHRGREGLTLCRRDAFRCASLLCMMAAMFSPQRSH